MNKFIGAIFAAEVFLCALSVSAQAATMNFDESSAPGGDFANFEDISNLRIGTTPTDFMSVSGSLSGACTQDPSGFIRCSSPSSKVSPDDTRDTLIFAIADKRKLAKVSVSSKGTGPDGFKVGFALISYVPELASPGGKLLIGPELNEDTSFKLSAGTEFNPYSYGGFNTFGITVDGFTAKEVGSYALDWNVNLEFANASATSVPIPASAPLLFAALGGLTALRRRRQRAARSAE